MSANVLRARDLHRDYQVSRGFLREPATLHAVAGASFEVAAGKTLAVVGESGCGKSTLARLITMVELPTSGTLQIDGADVIGASAETLRGLRSKVQMVFQNPYGSLNPRKQVGEILEEPLEINTPMKAAERRTIAQAMIAKVGLRPEHYSRYPHMFSGGQRQRIAIARALLKNAPILILDEATSNLDVETEREVNAAIRELSKDRTTLTIAHRLSTVMTAGEILVLEQGRIVEQGTHADLLRKDGVYARIFELQQDEVDARLEAAPA